MKKYLLQFGITGGFNDVENYSTGEFPNEEAASIAAWQMACEKFDEYSLEQYGIEPDADEETINEERDQWLDYSAVLYDDEKHKDLV